MLYYTKFTKIYDTEEGLKESKLFNNIFFRISDLKEEINFYKVKFNPICLQLNLYKIKGLCFYNRKGEPRKIIWL